MILHPEVTDLKIIKSFHSLPERFAAKHGDKYDYSKVVLVKMLQKVIIICPIHGLFLQSPSDHAKGFGCDKCSREESGRLRSLTLDKFIERAIEIHGDKYDYSKIKDFKNGNTKVPIICKEHGEFLQIPHSHLTGCGCPRCGDLSASDKTTKSLNEFLLQAKEVHGDRYDYSKVDYKKSHIKVEIICPIHGSFKQNCTSHLAGHGCPECSVISRTDTTSSFIEKAIKVHGDTYDYSKVEYIGNKKKVDIICKTHGVFSQRCDTHLSGHGCPVCASARPPVERHKDTPTYFYVIKYRGLYKIGVSLEGAKQRYRWEVDSPDEIEILTEYIIQGYDQAFMFEQFLMNKYYKYRYYGDRIFKYTGITEIFTENIYEIYLSEEI